MLSFCELINIKALSFAAIDIDSFYFALTKLYWPFRECPPLLTPAVIEAIDRHISRGLLIVGAGLLPGPTIICVIKKVFIYH
ncbi:hypothetical protein Shell_1577 [Staphylothermus hellenicus DSM 12710]|uniref:Uncharacterized protein n=1 Tax=Staphylothermus hellenicus (strain DSM 12710 / JCM 10830 / BK20S6-10-b1 / P8) TaxID=591019 RepID=D7DA69_STAHD|nr:hypothetical protein Shell_1577 [Staphylothermus hellenicus DSM 12710]